MPELGGEPEVGGVERADHLAAQLQHAAVVEHDLLDAAARPAARLEQLHVGAGGREVARGGEAGQAGAEDQDVAAHRSTWPCSGRQPTRTWSPSSQRLSERARSMFCSSATSRASPPSSTMICVVVPR